MRVVYSLLLASAMTAALSGCVPVVAGGAAVGGSAAADRRTSGAYVEDESIEWKTSGRIKDQLGDKIHLNVTSFNRNVLLTGEALNDATKAKAENLARTVENVRNVTNELQISGPSSLASRSNDAYLTTKVKGAFFTENRFSPIYVKVVTENSVVYLLGMVTHKEADDAVEIARGIEGVSKVVKVFEYIE
jgi:osmotically-inducible protein OsmY